MAELDQFVYLAKSYSGRACVALIQQVLNHKKIFVFGELLAVASIKALKEGEFAKSYSTLELFGYGIYEDYVTHRENYLDLSEMQERKLRQLTLVTMAHNNRQLGYNTLLTTLQLDSIRTLEDLIIDSIYSGLVVGKLNQIEKVFRVKEAMGRDVPEESISEIIEKLTAWKARCERAQTAMEAANKTCQSGRDEGASEATLLQLAADDTKAAILDDVKKATDKRSGFSKDDRPRGPRGAADVLMEMFGLGGQ